MLTRSKTLLATSVLLLGLISSTAFASADKAIHSSKNLPQTKSSLAADCHATDIWVKNHSDYIVYLDVVGTDVHDKLYPGDTDDVYSNSYYSGLEIVLSGQDGHVFFDQFTPNHQTIDIYNPQLGQKQLQVNA